MFTTRCKPTVSSCHRCDQKKLRNAAGQSDIAEKIFIHNKKANHWLLLSLNAAYFATVQVKSDQDLFLSFSWHLNVIRMLCHALVWLSFLYFLTRYYNCVPFAGCVFVGPSKICQPRVKTFEELPLEMHPQKAPQVSPLSSHQLLRMVGSWWHFLNGIGLLGVFPPQIITKNSCCCRRWTWVAGVY